MRASEFVPLIWQVMVVIGFGDGEELLGKGPKIRVVDAMYHLLKLRTMLWKPEITEMDLRGIRWYIGL